jgi:hypothetical protein
MISPESSFCRFTNVSSVAIMAPTAPFILLISAAYRRPTGLHFYGGNHRGYTDYPSWISRFEVVETT